MDLAQLLADVRGEAALAGHLYYLADPRAPRRPRYVGMTKDLVSRGRSHAGMGGTPNAQLAAWKVALRAEGLAPRLVPIAAFPNLTEARAAEWRLIHRWRRRGFCDLNSERDGCTGQWSAMCAARLARLGLA